METIQYSTIDKSEWKRGVWDNEPDKIQFLDSATGYPCLIVRSPVSGSLCGYVGVPDTHPMFGKLDTEDGLNAHGGITFADTCDAGAPECKGICHKPGPGEPDHVWWFGFDCAHWGDITPAMLRHLHSLEQYGTYKTVEYVTGICRELAEELKGME